MAIYHLSDSRLEAIEEIRFRDAGIRERQDLQRLLRDQFEIIAPDMLVIAEEFGKWEDSRRRIDLLGIDKEANLAVIELKRTEDGGHMELQAIRYAAMVSTMTFDQVVGVFSQYLDARDREEDARQTILDFLEWDEPDEDAFGQDVRILLISADFSKEVTGSVLWLNDHDLNIQCFRLRPYRDSQDRVLIDVQQVIPLPEATDYQVRAKQKKQKERTARKSGVDLTKYDLTLAGEVHTQLAKRNALYLVARHLVEQGVAPERITEILGWRKNLIWRDVDGEVDVDTFVECVARWAKEKDKPFGPRRWFCKEGELLVFQGRTYAFSNQWGGEGWRKAMDRLIAACPEHGISYEPSES